MPSLRRQDLPLELTSPQSKTTQLVSLVGDLQASDPDREIAAAKTRDILRRNCSSYRVSRIDDLLCRSGEDTGQAFRGAACASCTAVGQFSKNMVFVGQITLAPRRPQHQL
jgi:hypothetical protein